MASGDREYIADKETLDSVKGDTGDILTDTASLKSSASTIIETGYAVLDVLKGQRPKRYGYRVKVSESDTSGRVEYLYDAVGMTPAKMDYTTDTFNYGSWADLWFIRDNYACMVKSDGTEDYKLDPNDYTKKLRDGSASDVSNQSYDGNVMSAIPETWVNRYQEGGYQYVVFCPVQYDESYKAYAHTRPDGTIAKFAYHAAFKGSLISSKLRSIAGVYPQSNTTAPNELTYAQANGSKWTIKTWALHELITDLLILISKSTNTRASFGQGNISGYDSTSATYGFKECGSLKTRGQFYGTSGTTDQVKVFHIEGFWGDRWDRLVGLLYINGVFKAKMTPEGSGYNFTGDGYTAIGTGITGAASGSGWQRATEQTEYGNLPVAPLSGSDTTFEAVYVWFNNGIVAVALVGGHCAYGSGCGARSLIVNTPASSAWWYIGASLSLLSPS